MKPVWKGIGLTLAALAAAVVLAWLGLFGYWDVRIRGAMRTVDRTPTDDAAMQRAFRVLDEAGCRRLPYLIATLDRSDDMRHQVWRIGEVFDYFLSKARTDSQAKAVLRILDGWEFRSDDSKEERRRKCKRIQAWWQESGAEYHHWWKLWSSRCRPAPPE
jgi:hypothetical protein